LAIVAALCSGITVANIYFPQALLTLIARSFQTATSQAATLATAALVGYAVGILFVVPLGDAAQPRTLIRVLTLAAGAFLAVGAFSPNLGMVVAVTCGAAIASVVPQVLIPLVVAEAGPTRRAPALALVQIGLITGMMGSRVVFGLLGQWVGWRGSYAIAAALTIAAGLLTATRLPTNRPPAHSGGYLRLLTTLPGYLAKYPTLRWACARQAALFAAFNAVWASTTPILTTAPFKLSTGTAGLVGLLGLAGAPCALLAARMTQRRSANIVGAAGLAILIVALVPLALGRHTLAWLLLGLLLLPIGLQVAQVAAQVTALSADDAAGGRLNTIFMFSTFLAGAVGLYAGAATWSHHGIVGLVILAAGFLGLSLLATIAPAALDTLSKTESP
jgi:predicted MFS family arabinose efflux permease